MVEITNRTTSLQAEGLYGVIKVVGNTEVAQDGVIRSVAGSLYKKDDDKETYLGSFNSNAGLSVNIDSRENSGLLGDVAAAIGLFLGDLQAEIGKGGAQ